MFTFIVFCAGASASGKTTFSRMLEGALKREGVSTKLISMDNYYKERNGLLREENNFDVPDAFDLPLLRKHVQDINAKIPIDLPQFCFKIKDRLKETIPFDPRGTNVVIIEGIQALHDINSYKIPEQHKYCIFVEVDSYLDYLKRRIIRDIPPSSEGGRSTTEEITRQRELKSGVRDAFFQYIAPSKRNAHYKISNNNRHDLNEALQGVVDEIISKLKIPVSKPEYSVAKLISMYILSEPIKNKAGEQPVDDIVYNLGS
ncbi:MAG: hypothetical protein H0T84_11570 [Tatlockia sp.]|nr:hypothetical protein [Tatlockia sp.]